MDSILIEAENTIKIEEVKLEPEDYSEEDLWDFTEEGKPYLVKAEAIEEEEDLKPIITVFLNPGVVPNAVVKQEIEDPLAMGSENILGKTMSVGGEDDSEDSFSDSKTRLETDVEKRNVVGLHGDDQTLVNAGMNPKEIASPFSRSPKSNNTKNAADPVQSFSESGCQRRAMQKTVGCHECSQCQKSFPKKAGLAMHMRTHSGKHLHECSVCGKNFKQRGHLLRHMQIHSDEHPYECSVCRKNYIRKGDLDKHMRIHSVELSHECRVCQKSFLRRDTLVTHMQIHSVKRPRPHECSVCQRKFTWRNGLVTHMRIHSAGGPYECSVCQKLFVREGDLVTHMQIHSDENPHESCLPDELQRE